MSTTSPSTARPPVPSSTPKKDKARFLYVAVIVAVALGIVVGFAFPDFAVQLKWLGTLFVNLVKMMISPIIFCTLVLGVGSVRKAASVGKVGGLALAYFLLMSTVALAVGLVVGNFLQPGSSLQLNDAIAASGQKQVGAAAESTVDFVLGIIPTSLLSSLTAGSVLQTLLVALLVGFALQMMGKAGDPILVGIKHLETLVFKVMAMVMWVAPVGAFGAIAAIVGATGSTALKGLGLLMLSFYLTCAIFVFGILGSILKAFTGVSVFRLFRYLAAEFLLILSTSSSESALPRVIAKMEHLGIERSTVGISIPTGYSFNLDGTAIYLTMSSLFIAEALQKPFSLGEQVALLLFMIIASKGAAGVSGAGLATLAGGLSSHRPDLVGGIGFIVGIDRFMSEARALTNFAGNSIACVLVGSWTKTIDMERVEHVLSGNDPWDATMLTSDELVEDAENDVSSSATAPPVGATR